MLESPCHGLGWFNEGGLLPREEVLFRIVPVEGLDPEAVALLFEKAAAPTSSKP